MGRSGTRCAQEWCCRNRWWRATDPTSHSARSGGPAPYTDTAYTRWNSLLVKLSNILNWGSCGAVGRSGTRCAQEWCCRNRWWRATDPTSHSARSGGPAPYTDTAYTRWNSLLVKLSNILNWGSCGAVGRSGTRCAQEWCCRNRWWRATDPTSHSARSGGPAPYTDTGYTRWNSLLDSSETVKHT